MWQKPELIFVCGCNGAGKSTLTRAAHCLEKGYALLDPDRISLVSKLKSPSTYILLKSLNFSAKVVGRIFAIKH